jgi:ABC-2 type transport system permease protein
MNATSASLPRGNRLSPGQFVQGTWAVARREVAAYFDSPIAYVYTIAFVLLANSIFMNEFFLAGRAELAAFFDNAPLLLAVFLPAVTMRLFAEERKQRTIELLLTLPIRPLQAVVAKFLAASVLLFLFLLGSLPLAVMVFQLGDPDAGRLWAGYLGVLLLGGQLLALGLLLSACAGDQIVAFVLSTVVSLALVLTGQPQVVAVLDGLSPALAPGTLLLEYVSVLPPFEAFGRGVVSATALVRFAGSTALFLWLAAVVLDRRRG